MSVKQILQKRVTEVYGDPSPNVYKGLDYYANGQYSGWWYRPFNTSPVWLGDNKNDALETLDQIEEYQEEVTE